MSTSTPSVLGIDLVARHASQRATKTLLALARPTLPDTMLELAPSSDAATLWKRLTGKEAVPVRLDVSSDLQSSLQRISAQSSLSSQGSWSSTSSSPVPGFSPTAQATAALQ